MTPKRPECREFAERVTTKEIDVSIEMAAKRNVTHEFKITIAAYSDLIVTGKEPEIYGYLFPTLDTKLRDFGIEIPGIGGKVRPVAIYIDLTKYRDEEKAISQFFKQDYIHPNIYYGTDLAVFDFSKSEPRKFRDDYNKISKIFYDRHKEREIIVRRFFVVGDELKNRLTGWDDIYGISETGYSLAEGKKHGRLTARAGRMRRDIEALIKEKSAKIRDKK